MSQSSPRDFPLRANEPTFMGIPPELRLMIYEQFILDFVSERSFGSPVIVVGFCCKTYEVKPHTSTFRRQAPVITILHLCQKVRYEAEPLVYAHFTFFVDIRPHLNPLDLSGGVGNRLSHARTIQLHITNDTACGLFPYRPEHDLRSVPRERGWVSWDGGSSFDWEISRTQVRTALERTCDKSWPPWRSYLDRLDALLDFLNRGRSLRCLRIFICDVKSGNLDDRATWSLLNHARSWVDFDFERDEEFSLILPQSGTSKMLNIQCWKRRRRGRTL